MPAGYETHVVPTFGFRAPCLHLLWGSIFLSVHRHATEVCQVATTHTQIGYTLTRTAHPYRRNGTVPSIVTLYSDDNGAAHPLTVDTSSDASSAPTSSCPSSLSLSVASGAVDTTAEAPDPSPAEKVMAGTSPATRSR